MKVFTKKQALAMKGVEFTYITDTGRKVRAYVAKVDLEVGLTCLAMGSLPETSRCFTIKEGAELICVNLAKGGKVEAIHTRLESIESKGEWAVRSSLSSGMNPCAFL
jgi:hypothetical protein